LGVSWDVSFAKKNAYALRIVISWHFPFELAYQNFQIPNATQYKEWEIAMIIIPRNLYSNRLAPFLERHECG